MHYGIPGFMQKEEEDSKLELDPVPGVLKQRVKRTLGHVIIEYEASDKTRGLQILELPAFKHAHCSKFLFYCHAPDVASYVHTTNYACFLKNAWPSMRDDPQFFVCILHNVSHKFGYEWLSQNTLIIRRPNTGFDFGAFADGLHFTSLDTVGQSLHNHHPLRVFFMNDTVYGPTFPWWMKQRVAWTDVFGDMITEDVKLAGMTINPWFGTPHVQSMLMVTDHVGLEIGLRAKVFARRSDKNAVINESEAGFSTAILKSGFNIDCAAELLHGFDYRVKTQIPRDLDDVTYDNRYAGFSVHPFETVFSKTNRMHETLSKLLMEHSEKIHTS